MMKRRRGGNFASNPSNNSNKKKTKRRRGVRNDSDDDNYDSDEDYVLNEEDDNGDDDEEEEFIDGFLLPSSDEEDSFKFGDDDEENKKKKKKKNNKVVVRSKFKNNNSSSSIDINRGKKETRARQSVSSRTKAANHVDDDEEEEAYDFDDDDDDDDVEFNPNELEDEEEEEFLQVETRRGNVINSTTNKKKTTKKKTNKMKKKSAPVSHRNGSVKTHKVLKRPPKKKQKRLMVSDSASSDDDFDVDYRARPERSRKQNKTTSNFKNRRRRKSLVDDDLDSDFVSSGPSDIEYTVSDEEKELLKEANNFIAKPTTRTRNPSLFSRSLHLDDASTCQRPRPLRIKGKEKVSTLQEDTVYQVCGICFSEEGKGIVRGTLNCCSHFFCFACIMEWSKVESRCPLCKQRFTSISKPARSNLGVDLRNMVIQVPKRDQVYQPSEEELRGYLDPYDGVVCIECQIGGDDSLMLLCDICDSPAHTYCVGLGREVPEGNWYCRGCNPGSSSVHIQDPSQGVSNSSIPTHPDVPRINVEDINPTPQFSMSAPNPPSMHESGTIPSPRYPVTNDVHLASPTGVGVSTLSGRRRIHRQIHNLLSNNRMSQIIETSTRADEGNIEKEVVADSEDEQIRNPTTETARTSVSSGFCSADFDVWPQDGNPSWIRERDPNLTRLSHLRRQSTIVNGTSSGDLFAELEQRNSLSVPQLLHNGELERRNSVLVSQQLHRCSNSSYIQGDDSKSPRQSTSLEEDHLKCSPGHVR